MIYIYIISSTRANKRPDEYRNILYSEKEYQVGDIIPFDGLKWVVEDIVEEDENE